jgi:HPt (histidine-containing phosphotransfer) domain-containing protein
MTELRSVLDSAMLDQLRESVGDDPEFLAELVDEFLQDAPAQLASLREAAASGVATDARRAAHTLKGNSRTFGATQLASLCQEAETAAGNDDLDAVRSSLDGIEDEWQRVSAELLVWRDGRG